MSARRALWAGWAVSSLMVLVATVAAEATPHVRGLGFFAPLRLAVLVPTCAAVAIALAFARRALGPHRGITVALLGIAATLCLLAPLAAVPAVLGAAAVALLVPRMLERPRFRVLLTVLASLELLAAAAAWLSERPGQPVEATGTFAELPGGVRVHYVDEGTGETLLFLHGNPSWSFQWRDLIQDLHAQYRCVAPDLPGFGASSAPEGFDYSAAEQSRVIEALVDHLQLHDVTLVLQDWGGPVGLAFAERRPELVKRIVLGSTWAWPTAADAPRGQWSRLGGGPVGEVLELNFNVIATSAIALGIVRPLPADTVEAYVRPFRPVSRRGVAAFYPQQILGAHDFFVELEAGLPRLADKDALIFWALDDPGFPRAELERWQRTFPRSRTIELPGANHFFFEDARDVVVRELRAP